MQLLLVAKPVTVQVLAQETRQEGLEEAVHVE